MHDRTSVPDVQVRQGHGNFLHLGVLGPLRPHPRPFALYLGLSAPFCGAFLRQGTAVRRAPDPGVTGATRHLWRSRGRLAATRAALRSRTDHSARAKRTLCFTNSSNTAATGQENTCVAPSRTTSSPSRWWPSCARRASGCSTSRAPSSSAPRGPRPRLQAQRTAFAARKRRLDRPARASGLTPASRPPYLRRGHGRGPANDCPAARATTRHRASTGMLQESPAERLPGVVIHDAR